MMLYGKKVTVSDFGLKTLDEAGESKESEVSITSQLYMNALELDLILGYTSTGNPSKSVAETNTTSSTGSDFGMGLAIGSILF